MKTKDNTSLQRLSDDWVSEYSQWFKDYENSFQSTMPDVVSSFVQKKSLDDMSSSDILRTLDWLRDNPVTHVKTRPDGYPHVTPYVDEVTGVHSVGYYKFDEGFLDHAMTKGWLSLPVAWYYGRESIAGIADTFEEVQAHVNKLTEQYNYSKHSFVRKQHFVVLVRETSDLSLVHEFSHVGQWGQGIRSEQWANSPCPIGYPEKKELEKMKRVIHYQHLKSHSMQIFNEKFTQQFSDWSKSAFKEYEFSGHHPHCTNKRPHNIVHKPNCTNKPSNEIPWDSEKLFGFPVFTMQSNYYEQACHAFEHSRKVDGVSWNKIFQFEILKIASDANMPPTHPADIW